MNRLYFFFGLFAGLMPLALAAQLRYQMGFLSGVQYTLLRSDMFTTASGRVAPVVGFAFAVGPRRWWELTQEVVLTEGGAHAHAVYFRADAPPESHLYTYKFYSFETALLVGWQPSRDVPLWLQAGGFLGGNFDHLNRRQRELMIGDYENINRATRAVELNDAFSGLDYGLAAGIALGEGRFRANARYYLGVKNLYRYLDFATPGPYLRTSALRCSLAYFLK
ncbi:MAG: hypothetical protein RMJ33_08290 [Saprospiraceae bacterium]|nr:PorT family protein [Saprospiraceae bacterium]MDW8229822.1 hypothetical protein [Saprospiraceae bacterium]